MTNMQYRVRPRSNRLCDVTIEYKDGTRKQVFDVSEICGIEDGEFRWLEFYKPTSIKDTQVMVFMLDTYAVRRWYWEDIPIIL